MRSFEGFNNDNIPATAGRYSKPYMKLFKQPKCGCYKGRFNTCHPTALTSADVPLFPGEKKCWNYNPMQLSVISKIRPLIHISFFYYCLSLFFSWNCFFSGAPALCSFQFQDVARSHSYFITQKSHGLVSTLSCSSKQA